MSLSGKLLASHLQGPGFSTSTQHLGEKLKDNLPSLGVAFWWAVTDCLWVSPTLSQGHVSPVPWSPHHSQEYLSTDEGENQQLLIILLLVYLTALFYPLGFCGHWSLGILRYGAEKCWAISPSMELWGLNLNPVLLNWQQSVRIWSTHFWKANCCLFPSLLTTSLPFPFSFGLQLIKVIYIDFNSEIL